MCDLWATPIAMAISLLLGSGCSASKSRQSHQWTEQLDQRSRFARDQARAAVEEERVTVIVNRDTERRPTRRSRPARRPHTDTDPESSLGQHLTKVRQQIGPRRRQTPCVRTAVLAAGPRTEDKVKTRQAR
jgi:hypothetical protein